MRGYFYVKFLSILHEIYKRKVVFTLFSLYVECEGIDRSNFLLGFEFVIIAQYLSLENP